MDYNYYINIVKQRITKGGFTMKKLKFVISILSIFLLILTACGNETTEDSSKKDSVDQSFLNDVEKATTKRWELADKEVTDKTDLKEYDSKLVSSETEILSKYSDKKFNDVKLQALAEKYLEGLDKQKDATKYINVDLDKYEKLWSEGYDLRSTALLQLQDEYNVKLDEDEFADLKTNAQIINKEKKYTAKIDEMIKNIKFNNPVEQYGWYEYSAVVENTSGVALDYLELDIDLMDKEGVVVDTANIYHSNVWKPNQKIRLEFQTEKQVDKMEWTADYEIVLD